MRFSVLGPLAVVDDVGATVAVGGSKRRDLLLRLLIDANRVVPNAVLIEDLWRGEPPPGAEATLQSHVSHLRNFMHRGRFTLRYFSSTIPLLPHSSTREPTHRIHRAPRPATEGRP